MLHSIIMCVKVSCSSSGHSLSQDMSIDLALEEDRFPVLCSVAVGSFLVL